MRQRQNVLRLFDTYAPLLTAHQRRILHLYLELDWSYGEIAEREGVSRSAVYDLMRRAVTALETHEKRLGLVASDRRRASALDRLHTRLEQLEREMGAFRRALQRLA